MSQFGQGLILTDEDGNERVLYAPNSQGQMDYHLATEPNVLMYGNRGGGKSHCGRWDAHMRALAYPGFTYCILRRTYPELQKTHLIHINHEMKLLGGYFHNTDKIAYYPNGSKGFFAHCAGEEDVLKLLSAEFYLMFFDELSTFEWEMFTKLATSCRVPANAGLTAMVRGGTNPLGVSAEEIAHYFIDKDVDPEEDPDYNPEDWRGIKVQAEDNVNLDTKQYQKRFAGMPAHVRKAWVDGEFALENAMFDVQPQRRVEMEDGSTQVIPWHYVQQVPMEKVVKAAQIYRTYDHGYFPDPAVCLWIAHLGDRFLVLHEQLWFKTIAADIAKDIRETTKNLGIERVVTTYCDPSIDIQTGADVRTIKDIFELNGVPMESSINSRELYASAIHTALAEELGPTQPRMQIYVKGCPYLAKTITKQKFDPKYPLRMQDSKTDHATIALAYFLISNASGDRAVIDARTRKMRPWMIEKSEPKLTLGHESVK